MNPLLFPPHPQQHLVACLKVPIPIFRAFHLRLLRQLSTRISFYPNPFIVTSAAIFLALSLAATALHPCLRSLHTNSTVAMPEYPIEYQPPHLEPGIRHVFIQAGIGSANSSYPENRVCLRVSSCCNPEFYKAAHTSPVYSNW